MTFRLFSSAVLLALLPAAGQAQPMLSLVPPTWSEPLLTQEFWALERMDYESVRQTATPRLRMFGMPTGFLAVPYWLEDEDDARLVNDPVYVAMCQKADDMNNVQVSLGMDNPFFDLRRPGSVGGVGYYQIYSQVQVVDSGKTSMCLNLQAYTPAGVQFGGLANGPSYVCPALSFFHDLGWGTALQGFVSENISTGAGWEDNWNRKMFYGMAWQCPLAWDRTSPQGLFFFVQALGHANYDPAHSTATHPAMMVLPGLQWRLGDNCWLSLGGSQHGLLSCFWRF